MAETEVRYFYRILEGPVPTLRDCTSYEALGRPLRRQTPELLRRWSGISVYETEEQARGIAMRRPSIGRYIATIRIEPGAPIRIERTGDPNTGHHTLRAEPAKILKRIVSIVPVQV